jgi:hypothetical protein
VTRILSSGTSRLTELVPPLSLRQDKQWHIACVYTQVNDEIVRRGPSFLPLLAVLLYTHI